MSEIDWENLLEEIEDLADSQKRFLESQLERLIEHILKLQYWEEERDSNYRHWQSKVVGFRCRIKRLLRQNSSLEKYFAEVYPEIFPKTRSLTEIASFVCGMEICNHHQ
jgi:Domain of unknown function DUF29